MKAFFIFILVIVIVIFIFIFYKITRKNKVDTSNSDYFNLTQDENKNEKQFGIKILLNKFLKYNDIGLTREEKETSNKFRKELLHYRIFSKITYQTIKEIPQLEKFVWSESDLQHLKENEITKQKEKLAKFPYLIYFHACNRLNITPLNEANIMSFAGEDIFSSIFKATEHTNVLRALTNTLTKSVDLLAIFANNEAEIDGVFKSLIDKTVEALKKNENK